jgi:hypothetical protein
MAYKKPDLPRTAWAAALILGAIGVAVDALIDAAAFEMDADEGAAGGRARLDLVPGQRGNIELVIAWIAAHEALAPCFQMRGLI